MLNYLRIFSWFLLTFGVVGFLTILTGLVPNFGSSQAGMGLMGLQALVGGVIVYGFRLLKQEAINPKLLLYGGWIAVIIFVIVGQIWTNQAGIKL